MDAVGGLRWNPEVCWPADQPVTALNCLHLYLPCLPAVFQVRGRLETNRRGSAFGHISFGKILIGK
jgi:hypothetical protein